MWRIAIVGLPLFLAVFHSTAKRGPERTTTLFTLAVMSVVVGIQVTLAEHNILVSQGVLRTATLVGTVLLLRSALSVVATNWKEAARSLGVTAGLFIGAALPWIYPLQQHSSVLFGAPFSNSNNDLALYVVSADNFLNVGFREFGRVVGYQAGALANFEVAGASSLISTLSKITDAPIWRVTTLAMLLVMIMTVVASFELARSLNLSNTAAALVSVLGNLAPYSITIPQNFFLSQAIARLTLVIGLLSIARLIRANSRGAVVAALFGVWSSVWLSLVTYPSGTIVSFAFAGLMLPALVLGEWRRRDWETRRRVIRRLLLTLLAVICVSPLLVSRLSLIQSNISLYSAANVTGWPAPTDSILRFLGIPSGYGAGFTLFVVVLVVLGIVGFKVRSDNDSVLMGVFVLLAVVFVYALVSTRVGSSAYQTWKTLASIQFAVPLSLALMAIGLTSRFESRLVRNLPLGLLGALVLWSSHVGGDTYRHATQLPTMELEIAAEDPRLPQSGLLIALNPYLETMLAPIVLDITDTIYASDTYLGPGSIDPTKCSLFRGRDEKTGIQLTRSLQIGPRQSCLGP